MSTTRCSSDGRLHNRGFNGHIAAHDPNLDFDFFGLVDLNDSIPNYDFTMHLNHADLARLHINRRDSISQLSARIVAKARGRSLDDLNGRIQIADANYRYNDQGDPCLERHDLGKQLRKTSSWSCARISPT